MICEAVVEFGQPLQRLELPTPMPTGTQVLVRVRHCGVCHSDVHIHDGYFSLGGEAKAPIRTPLPFALGHEIEGEVVAVGPDAADVAVGDRRAVFPWIGCGDCPACKRGEEMLCGVKPAQLGVHTNGGFASHVLVPHPRYLLDFGTLPPALAATYMCSGLTAFGALKKMGAVTKDDPVLIVGLGGVGMMALQFARAMFDGPVYGADIDANKRQAALGAGASGVFDPKDPADLQKLLAETGGGTFGAADFVGNESSFQFATGAIRRGGKVVVVGLYGGAMAMPIIMFPFRAMSIAGSMVASLEETREMMEIVRAGKVDPIPVQTRPLAAANATLDDLRAGRIVGRVVLEQ